MNVCGQEPEHVCGKSCRRQSLQHGHRQWIALLFFIQYHFSHYLSSMTSTQQVLISQGVSAQAESSRSYTILAPFGKASGMHLNRRIFTIHQAPTVRLLRASWLGYIQRRRPVARRRDHRHTVNATRECAGTRFPPPHPEAMPAGSTTPTGVTFAPTNSVQRIPPRPVRLRILYRLRRGFLLRFPHCRRCP